MVEISSIVDISKIAKRLIDARFDVLLFVAGFGLLLLGAVNQFPAPGNDFAPQLLDPPVWPLLAAGAGLMVASIALHVPARPTAAPEQPALGAGGADGQ